MACCTHPNFWCGLFCFFCSFPLYLLRRLLDCLHFLVARKHRLEIEEFYLPRLSVDLPASELIRGDSTRINKPPRVIRPLKSFHHLSEEVALVLSRAFYNDPYHHALFKLDSDGVEFFSTPQQRHILREALPAIFRLHYLGRSAFTYFISDRTGPAVGVLRGAAIWQLRHDEPTFREVYGHIDFSLRWGISQADMDDYERIVTEAVQVMKNCKSYHYLVALGVDPQSQGHGYGMDLLQPMLDLSDEISLPCFLESSNQRNVEFYQRAGFVVKKVLRGIFGSAVVTLMRRDPRVSEEELIEVEFDDSEEEED